MVSNIFSIFMMIVIFGILVIVHEFGHYIFAKKNGVVVYEFAVGMGPILISKKIGETLYSIRAFPLGGFCRMMGEDEESDNEGSMANKSVWARICIVAAGPLMNFILALLLILYLVTTSFVVKPEISSVLDGSVAESVGLQVGDELKKVNGKNIYVYDDFIMQMQGNNGTPIELELKRDGKTQMVALTPRYDEARGSYLIGFTPQTYTGLFSKEIEGVSKASVWDTLEYSVQTMGFYVRSTVVGLFRAFTFSLSADEIAGPIGMVEIVGDAYESGLTQSVSAAIRNMVYLAALLSTNLGVLNLFPIPALDGGRLIFLALEGIRRRPIPPEVEGRVHFAGFVLLIAFMVFVAYNDIARLLVG